nr:uncharacterized protein LOC128691324 [Cherax quadricarinatus]
MNDKMELPVELKEALNRVMSKKKMELSPLLDCFDKLKIQEDTINGAEIYANKEILSAQSDHDSSPISVSELNELMGEIEELQHALINHRLVRDTMQESAFKIQIQEAVHNSIQSMDTGNFVDLFPEKGFLLSHYSNNLNTSKELLSVIQEKEELDREIFDQRLKYRKLLQDIREKWLAVEHNMVQVSEESESVTVLLLCDMAFRKSGKVEEDAEIKRLSELSVGREMETDKTSKSIKKYFTSTPKQK